MIDQITPAQFNDWLAAQDAGVQPLVLDVREAWEVQMAHIQANGFEVVHMPMQTVPARLQDLPTDRPIACLCHHGARSMQVAMFLAQRGFDRVANIAGGIHAWSMQVDPSVATY